jgi:hypothetical protein
MDPADAAVDAVGIEHDSGRGEGGRGGAELLGEGARGGGDGGGLGEEIEQLGGGAGPIRMVAEEVVEGVAECVVWVGGSRQSESGAEVIENGEEIFRGKCGGREWKGDGSGGRTPAKCAWRWRAYD